MGADHTIRAVLFVSDQHVLEKRDGIALEEVRGNRDGGAITQTALTAKGCRHVGATNRCAINLLASMHRIGRKGFGAVGACNWTSRCLLSLRFEAIVETITARIGT